MRALCILAVLALSTTSSALQLPWYPDEVRLPELLVSGYNSDAVHRFDPVSGKSLGNFSNVPGAQGMTIGPDGLLYVCAEKIDTIKRFDLHMNKFVDDFVVDDPLTPMNEAGSLNGPTSILFNPGGDLLIGSFNNDRILRYDGSTGAFLGAFVTAKSGGLDGPDAGMTFGPGGDLFVPSFYSDEVLRYDGVTGDSLGAFISGGSGGLSRPRTVRFHRDGFVYVSSEGSNEILRYDFSGNFVEQFTSTVGPTGMDIGRHDGDLYVTSAGKNYVKQFAIGTGTLIAKPVINGNGLVDAGVFLYFVK